VILPGRDHISCQTGQNAGEGTHAYAYRRALARADGCLLARIAHRCLRRRRSWVRAGSRSRGCGFDSGHWRGVGLLARSGLCPGRRLL